MPLIHLAIIPKICYIVGEESTCEQVYSLRVGADVPKDTPILYVGQDKILLFLKVSKNVYKQNSEGHQQC